MSENPGSLKIKPYVFAYYGTMVAIGLMSGCLGPTLGQLAAHIHVTLKEISLILALRPAGYMLGAVISGRLLDRMPGNPVLAVALLLAGSLLALVPWMPSLGLLVGLIVLMGLADGTLDVGVNTLLGWALGPRQGPYLNGMHFIFGLGALTAPLLIAQALRASGGIPLVFGVMGLGMFPVAFFLLRLPSPPHRVNIEPSEAPAIKIPWTLTAQLLGLFFLYGGAEAAFGGWISSYASGVHLTDVVGAAYVSSLFWASLALGRLISIPMALRFDLRWMLGADILGMILSLGAMLLWPASSAALWAGSAGSGFFMASFFPTLLSYAGKRLSPSGRVSGFMVSLFFVGSSTSSVLLPWLIGQGFESWGPWVAIADIFGFVLGLGIIFFRLVWSESNRSFPFARKI
jgi:FHS family Na+ dependent glucose MFS transporter 1